MAGDVMKDEEVGKLWNWLNNDQPVHWVSPGTAMRLIRKLVETLAELNYRRQGGKWPYVELTDREHIYWLNNALREFHISPATWPEEWR